MAKIRVLVVEDSLTVRKYLADVLRADPLLEVIGEAEDGKQAIELCQSFRPDVISMDMMLPVMTGLAATEYIMAYCPTPILVVTAVAIKLRGAGLSVTGRWPVSVHVQPYVRADYLFWQAEATGLGRTLAKDNGRSPGLALGAQFPIKGMFGVKAEVAGYNNVSGADIRQFSVGLTLDF